MDISEDFFNEKLADLFDELDDSDTLPILNSLSSIKDRYSEFVYLDAGGIKIIHRCIDLKTGREVAMASLKNKAKDSQKELFLKEARLTAALQHPNIIPLYDLGLKGDQPWFTMKLVSGQNLKQILQNLKTQESQQLSSLDERLDVFLKICDAVAYAHSRGVLHLDIKPDNIQISDYGDVLLCDWGLAKVMAAVCDEELLECYTFNPKESSLTIDGVIKGTPGYMAPEQTRLIKGKASPQTDIFSLGCVLYKILTLETPFQAGDLSTTLKKTAQGDFVNPSLLQANIPQSLEAVCLKALSVQAEDRYTSVTHLKNEILNYRQGFATNAENASLIKLTHLWFQRHRTLSFAAVSIIAISILASFIGINNLKLEKLNAQQKAATLELENLNSLQIAEKLKLEAEKLQLENKYQKTVNKGAAPRFFQRAQVAFTTHHFNDAINFCNSAVELDPNLRDAWALKGTLHLIYEEFNSAIQAYNKSKQKHKLLAIAKEFSQVKPDDKVQLDTEQFTWFFKRIQQMNNSHLTGTLIHHKAYSNISLNKRIELARKIIRAQNSKSIKRQIAPYKFNFHYDTKTRTLDIANNPWLQSCLILQNFPAYIVNLSNTNIKNFICFRNQPLRSLNVSGTQIIELQTLENINLRALNISRTSISNLTKLKEMSLINLNISHSAVRTAAVLKDLDGLEILTIHQGQLSKSDLKKLNPNVKVIIYNHEKKSNL